MPMVDSRAREPHIGGSSGVYRYEHTKEYYYKIRQAQIRRQSLFHNYSSCNRKPGLATGSGRGNGIINIPNMSINMHTTNRAGTAAAQNNHTNHTINNQNNANITHINNKGVRASNHVSISGWGPTITIDTW